MSMFGTRLVITVSGSTTHHVYPSQSIQEVINSAEYGDTIFVHAGIYYEHVVVDKALSLIGENRDTAIIDGNGTGFIFQINRTTNVVIESLTLQNCQAAVFLLVSNRCRVSGNVIKNCSWYGVWVHYSENNFIDSNVIEMTWEGIYLYPSENNIAYGNIFHNNSEAAIEIAFCSHNSILENSIVQNPVGLKLYHAYNNSIAANVLQNNEKGICLTNSNNNTMYHNNFINNTNQIIFVNDDDGSINNTWDDGYPSGGNYWSDYNGTDFYGGPYQNETGSDGIGDIPYFFDSYPLMKPYIPSEEMLVLYYGLLRKYNELQGNYDTLQTSYENLQTNYDAMNMSYNSLNSSYNELTSKHEATISELNYIKNLMYIFIITTIAFIATTAYFAIRKPKVKPELKTT